MKILLVSHRYPPAHSSGTEVYTANLAEGLVGRGHEVAVFTAEKDIARPHLSFSTRMHQGIAVHELVNNLHYRDFRATWDHPGIDPVFQEVLRREKPEVVHFHHLLYLSVGCVEAAAASGARVVFTLHDFWLQCPRFGQRLHADGTICETIDFERCGGCLTSFRYSNSPGEQRLAGWIAKLKQRTGLDLATAARRAGDWLRAREGDEGGSEPDPAHALVLARETELRTTELRKRLGHAVQMFLSPSRFLRDELVRWGVPAERIEHLPTGVDLATLARGARSPRGERTRVGFVGSLVPVKGVLVLLEAWQLLEPGCRERARLEIIGPEGHDLDFSKWVESGARAAGAELRGKVEHAEMAGVLRELDLLVVPSLWFENQPLVILEALAARTPLLVSDLGGMVELVEEGKSGWRFPVGDANALADRLQWILEDPSRLDALQVEAQPPPSLGDQVAAVEAIYERLARDGGSQ